MWAFGALLFGLTASDGFAASPERYGEGFEGRVCELNAPLDVKGDKDREIRLNIRLAKEPIAFPSDFTAAFKAACRRHVEGLRKMIAEFRNRDEWRVRITFDWVVSSEAGWTVTKGDYMLFRVNDCRPW